jgi:hypothetical protein
MLIGVLGLGISIAQSQTYINSWENSPEGWSAVGPDWASVGFSTTIGVMDGLYSWEVQNASGNFNWNQDGTQPDFTGPSSAALTTLLAHGSTVSVDVTVPAANDFGGYLGFSLYLNQPTGVGIVTISQWANWLGGAQMGPGVGATTLTFTIPASVRSAMLAHPGVASSLMLVTGGGGTGTMYLDGLRVAPYGQINSWEYSYEGWSAANTNFALSGCSATTGVTAGLYSLVVQNTSGNYIWDQVGTNADFESPTNTDLTTLLAQATNVFLDVTVPAANDFGGYLGFSLYLNQPGGAGIVVISQWANWLGGAQMGPTNGATTLSFPVSQAVRTALLNYPTLPCCLRLATGGGGTGTMYFDNLRVGLLPPTAANLWVRELWDDQGVEALPANTTVKDNSSSAGFDPASAWVVNPAETVNCALMGFRNFANDAMVGASTMCLPTTLDGSSGCMVQENGGFSFFPGTGVGSFWTAGDFMTRELTSGNYINFQAAGEYWFTMTIANGTGSLDAQWITQPATGAGGIGFADGSTTNADFVAIGVSGLNLFLGPGATNASKALYISQGTLGQPGDPYSVTNSPAPTATYSQTNFTGGPYHINAFSAASVGISGENNTGLEGDYITVLGHLTTHGDGTATLQAKYYGTGLGENSWNSELDMTTNNITWDCSYSFSFGGTMTKMLLFENGQFPFYVFGFRASKNFQDVVGLDPGRINVAPLANTYIGYAINMTNLAVEANSWSWAPADVPNNYGTLNYQWYQNGLPLDGATSQYLNIASASLTNAGTYTSVATDPSGTWGPVTNSVVISVTVLNPPELASVQLVHNGNTFMVSFDEPNLTGVGDTNNYVFTGGVVATNVTVINSATATSVQITTTPLPLGTKITLTITGVTNVVGGVLATTNVTLWTDLIQTGAANFDCFLCALPSSGNPNIPYFNTWLPANPTPTVVQSVALTSWDGPTTGITNVGEDGYVGDHFGSKIYGWFIPPVTTNYVFYISCDDGGRLSLSTNASSTNLFVIACDSDWSGPDEWTNISYTASAPHRGDGTASAGVGTASPPTYVWDNSVAGQSPATACLQNRSDQFIVAYYDSTGLPGGPAGATTSWANAESRVEYCVPSGMTNLWPQRDANGQALIHLQAGQMYYMQLESEQQGGGYDETVTYKIAGQPDPNSGVPGATPAMPAAPSALTGSNIAGTVPFALAVSISKSNGAPLITYTGVLLATTNLAGGITNVVAQSSAATAISLGGPSQYSPPQNSPTMFYRTSK